MILAAPSPMMASEVTDPTELAELHLQQQRFRRNSDWLQANVSRIYACHRGKYACVAGEELFVADSVEEALKQARGVHPVDNGLLVRYIPAQRMERIYAH
jgi:hypothetical protein